MRLPPQRPLAATLLFASFLLPPPLAGQTTWTVDLATDENDGPCVALDCSLREALADAADGDTIQFALAGAPPWTIRLASALGTLAVADDVTIDGPGAADLAISGDLAADGTGDLRVMEVAAATTVAISDLTLRDGRATSGAQRDGGCLRNFGSLTLTGVRFENCLAWSGGTGFSNLPGGQGGAIFNAAGATLAVDLAVFTANLGGKGDISPDGMSGAPGGSGGALATAGSATVRRSTFSANRAGEGGNPNGVGGEGGAIAVLAGGTLLFESSILTNNRSGDGRSSLGSGADGRGGGLFANGDATLNNVTLSGNFIGVTATGSAAKGGGLAVLGGTTRLRNVTVTGNSANGAGGGIARDGGTLRLRNSLIGGNTAGGNNEDCTTTAAASLISEGHNVVGVREGCATSLVGAGDQTGSAATPLAIGVDPLADNGGPTETHALQGTSPALDAGEPEPVGCQAWDPAGGVDVDLAADQRGEPRPTDGDGDGVVDCDGGAFEAPTAPLQQFDLTVVVAGSGAGLVESDLAGISCPSDCTESYDLTATVELTATPSGDAVFAGWSGDCAGTGTCVLAMSADRNVTATFTARFALDVTVDGDGVGSVASDVAGIACPGDCSELYLDGADVLLTASAGGGSFFGGWSGDCSGATATCALDMTAAHAATATFLPHQIFADGFESESVCAWDAAVGAPPCP